MPQLKWSKQYHHNGKLASIETVIVKTGFPGMVDTHRAIILPFETGTAMAYIRMNDNSDSYSTSLWANKTFKSVRAAQGWAKSVLERL